MRITLISLVAGTRDLLEGDVPKSWGSNIIQSILQMLGVPFDEAKALSRKKLPAYVTRIFDEA
ncbi:hypothetical protein F9288_13215 [Sphingomonas sp. CL5.1]|uniref:hypothetical protein n=1 Tax=Sphingomonas sp. CL5.1 TaxID=2653203 RepID=UPI0015831A82|nr:hypothetical protein [Sphingomonas sp. CL5.1]QKS00471.1 hypothetical protein F9288_13215 [Sphingomonas sp. CL5.1]